MALRLSAFYLVFIAAVGGFLPYWPLFLQSRGFGAVEIGTLLGLMTATRIVAPCFWGAVADRSGSRMRVVRNAAAAATLVFAGVLVRWRLEHLFAACFALTALRWQMIAWLAGTLGWVLVAQTLHAVSFGLYHGVAIQLVHREFPGDRQGRGQALYSSIGFGLGGAAGSLASGYAWHRFGAEPTWPAVAGVSALAGALVLWGMRR